jgi:hypothetical protein
MSVYRVPAQSDAIDPFNGPGAALVLGAEIKQTV